jgi:hypothetical protein
MESKEYFCNKCNKAYTARNSLWYHQKKCTVEAKPLLETVPLGSAMEPQDVEKLVQYLMKENAEFKQLLIDQNKQMLEQNKHMVELAKNAGHHNTNNSHNSFNLNFFLNDTCKNAMNIMDFVNQLQVGIKDLEETGRVGFAEGISNIFINGLKQVDITDRPMHCSDYKRETIYIKNDNQWHKETDDKALLTNAIKHVACKNMKQIPEWTKIHPEFNNYDSKENDKYLRIVSEAMSGSSEEETNKNYQKIIKNIVKETVIGK